MELDRIKFHNVLSYETLDLDFNQLSLALFVGENGAGKSNVFDGLSWIIFDRLSRKKYGKQKIIRDLPKQQDQAVGEIEFRMPGGSKYRLIRQEGIERGIHLERNGSAINFRTPTQSQEELQKIIGMDYNTYTNVACFSQGSPYKFLASESGERIKVLSSILGTDNYDKAVKLSDKRIRELEGNLYSIRGKIELAEQIVGNTDIKAIQTEKNISKAALEDVLNQLAVTTQWINNAEIKRELGRDLELHQSKFNVESNVAKERLDEFKQDKKKHEILIKSEEKTKKRLIELKGDLEQVESIKKRIVANQETYQDNQESMARLSAIMSSLKAQKQELELLIETGGNCLVCRADIADRTSDLEITISDIEEDYEEKRKQFEKCRSRSITMINEKDRLEKELIALRSSQVEHTELLQTIVAIKDAKYQMETIGSRAANYSKKVNERLSAIKKLYLDLKDKLTAYKDYDLDRMEARIQDRNRLETTEKDLERDLIKIELQQKQFNQATKTLGQLRKSVEDEEQEHQNALFWKQNFPRVKLLVISETIPYIEALTNHNLSKITDDLEIGLEVDPANVNNKLDVIITDKRGIKPKQRIFEGWSGGQKDSMSIASFLALNELASQVSGCKINFLLLDERFSSIDSNKRIMIFELLREARGNRKLLAISHVEDIEGEFNEIVRVISENGVSRLEIS